MTEKKQILSVLPATPAQEKRLLAAAGPDCNITFTALEKVSNEDLAVAQIILGNVAPGRLKDAPCLAWLQLYSAGSDPYEVPGVLAPDTQLTNAVGAYGPSVSEHLVASLLTLQKRLHQYRDNQQEGLWQDEGPVCSIAGNRVLIVGFGSIGSSLGQILHALGNQIVAIRRHTAEKPDWVEALHPMADLPQLLPQMDVVAVCLPSSGSTVGLFGAEQFASMKPGAYFLNGGRGNLVDTEALLQALQKGSLAGAALDVTDPEPLPQDHPLWHEPKALITPHVSGGFHLDVTMERIVDICCDNLRRFQEGQELQNLVSRK